MMKKFIMLLLFILIAAPMYATEGSPGYAIINATIIPVTSDTVSDGVLVIEGEKIAAIGQNLEYPADLEVIDARGLFVYPGLIDARTTIGLSEIGAVRATQDAYETGDFNPFIKAIVAVNAHSVHIPITRVNGITTVMTVPTGGIIAGQSALINLYGWTPEEMALKAPAALHVSYPQMPEWRREPEKNVKEEAEKRIAEQRKKLNEVFQNAQVYANAWKAYKNGSISLAPKRDLTLEALIPALNGEILVIIYVDQEKVIKEAVEFAEKYSLNYVLEGVKDGWKVAEFLAEKKVDVLFGSVIRYPGNKDPYDACYANAGILHKAGVKIALFTGNPDSTIGKISDIIIKVKGKSKDVAMEKETLAPYTSLFDISTLSMLDSIGGVLMNMLGVTEADIDKRHATIE